MVSIESGTSTTVSTVSTIQGKISSNGQITLGSQRNFQEQFEEANTIALVLKAGALPAPVTIFEERTVGATLGAGMVQKGTMAAIVGLALVLLFMAAYYRVSGLVADVALVLNAAIARFQAQPGEPETAATSTAGETRRAHQRLRRRFG